LTITATQEPDNDPPRVRLDVTTTGTATALFSITRTDPDGRSRRVILAANPRFTSSAATVYDYHAPFNQTCTWVIASESATASSSSVALTSAVSWLIHRTNSSLSVQIDAVAELADLVMVGTAATHFAFGATYPVTRSEGVRRAPSGAVTIRCESRTNEQAVCGCLADSGVVLLNLTFDGDSFRDVGWCWIQPGDVTLVNHGEIVSYPYRHLIVPYQVTDTPAGNLAADWDYSDIAAFSNYAALIALYDDYGDMTIDYETP
jgi:hypothetical protein